MANSNLKYLIAGTGGVGGSIAAFLSLSGKDVTCIARGEHLAAIRGNGLQLHSDLKGEHCLKVAAFTAEEFQGKADVIFVCVKGYSVDSITELIKRASHERTVVIPHPECLRNRSPYPAVGPRRHGARRLHLHRRIRIRTGRNHADGKDFPARLRSTPQHDCFP